MTSENTAIEIRETVDAIYQSDSRRVLATLIHVLGDFDLAEEALHDAFTAAVERWPRDGVPDNPRAWLVSTGRFKAIDTIRRRTRFDASLTELSRRLDESLERDQDAAALDDDRLRLIFTCCHPALPPDAQIALTLREVCGLTTEEIARAFLTTPPTVAQRIVRAKTKIRVARIPNEVPQLADLPARMDAVLHVIYLVFNEGYSASSGASLTRHDLSGEAIRLCRLLVELLPEPEAIGLLAPSGRFNRGVSGPTHCRPQLRPSMPTHKTQAAPTGRRSSASMTCSSAPTRHRWWSSIARSPWPWGADRSRGFGSSIRSCRVVISRTITSRIRRARISVGASDELRKHARRTSAR